MTKTFVGYKITGMHKDFEIRTLATCRTTCEAHQKMVELKKQGAVMLVIDSNYEWK